ncbi:MAG: glycoside hydrolase family 9 protein [Opitutales bacterium]|nr:glycoside hydrolase family 9 protein [Opitutales bacterium]
MKRKLLPLISSLALFVPLTGISAAETGIFLNQIGFPDMAPKTAITNLDSDTFDVCDAESGAVLFTGKTTPPLYWDMAGESFRRIDFTDFTENGSYVIRIGDEHSYPFEISNDVYESLAVASMRYFYLNRASVALPEAFAGAYSRPAGYPDTEVYIHKSAASETKPEGFVMSSPKGWFDAGDYNKYIVNSGITTYTLLCMYDLYKGHLEGMDLHIPESNNSMPDVLDEIRWNLDWMLTMQDSEDGGVYSKLSTLNFIGFVMPETSTEKRHIFSKSTAATLDFAATMAYASRVYRDYDAAYADECLNAAKRAWDWVLLHPDVLFLKNPEGVNTGMYQDADVSDEFEWAAMELAISTGDSSYRNHSSEKRDAYTVPCWPMVELLPRYSAALDLQDASAISDVLSLADSLVAKRNANIALNPMDRKALEWGSNGNAANMGMLMLIAYQLTEKTVYLETAQDILDYILGRNPLNICYVTGFGEKSPLYPHHRLSHADGVDAPYPGMLVGGANWAKQDGAQCKGYPESDAPAMCYSDELGSYASNEVAINWSAPFAFLVNGINAVDAEQSKTKE